MNKNHYICSKCKKNLKIKEFNYVKNSMYSFTFSYLLCKECVQKLKKVIDNWINEN